MHQHLSACQSVSAASINRALLAEIIKSIFVYFFLSLLSVHFFVNQLVYMCVDEDLSDGLTDGLFG